MPLAAAVVQSPPMTGYKSGAPTRRAILLALLESEPRTIRGLALVAGIGPPAMMRHLRRMQESGLVSVCTGMSGTPGRVTLTPAGREAAKLL